MRRAATLLAVLGAGCGLGFGEAPSGGADNLPTLGAGPYGKPAIDFDTPADEPLVIADRDASLHDPAALPMAGGGMRLWFGREGDDGTGDSAIAYAELADLTELPARGPEVVMAADQPWEDGRVAAPAVIDAGDQLVLYFEGGRDQAAATGRATSRDGGTSWQKYAENPIAPLVRPTVARTRDGWLMYGVLPGEPGIWRATSPDGLAWTLDEAPVLLPRPELPEAFDALAVTNPFLLVQETPAGRLHYGLFFNGLRPGGDTPEAAIGYAGSFDGRTWERFGAGEPILDAGQPSEHGPAVLLFPAQGVMFFSQERQRRQRIGVALHP